MDRRKANIWWGPPRKFTSQIADRRISWLELFYDLVYVIAISRITHYLAAHPDGPGLLDYLYLFTIIFWGWLNGSLYHDLHGSPGIRTRFITLWQMMAVAALVVCLGSPPDKIVFRSTIALMVIQFYITYLWWSVGFYDRNHRQYNKPYTVCYLLSLAVLFLTFFTESPFQRILFWIAACLNFLPPFLVISRLRINAEDFSLSASMTERLGLFTIIIFGECVFGVIQGTIGVQQMSTQIWVNFGLGILIVFALWWIFFALLADRKNKPGFLVGQTICLGYIPTLASLGMIGASFSGLFQRALNNPAHGSWITTIYGVSLCVFLLGIVFITRFLNYPEGYDAARRSMQRLLILAGLSMLLLTALFNEMSLFTYLLLVFALLLTLVVVITRIWYRVELKAYEKSAEN